MLCSTGLCLYGCQQGCWQRQLHPIKAMSMAYTQHSYNVSFSVDRTSSRSCSRGTPRTGWGPPTGRRTSRGTPSSQTSSGRSSGTARRRTCQPSPAARPKSTPHSTASDSLGLRLGGTRGCDDGAGRPLAGVLSAVPRYARHLRRNLRLRCKGPRPHALRVDDVLVVSEQRMFPTWGLSGALLLWSVPCCVCVAAGLSCWRSRACTGLPCGTWADSMYP